MKIRRVIGAADERPRGDVREAFPARDVAVEVELLRGDVADDREVRRRRRRRLALMPASQSRHRASRPSFESLRRSLPSLSMTPLFVTIPRLRDESSLARRRTWSEVRYFARERTAGVSRSTVSML